MNDHISTSSQDKHVASLLREAAQALGNARPQHAMAVLDKAMQLEPDHVDVLRLAGIAGLQTGHHVKAVQYLQRALALRPEDSTIHMTLGSVLLETGATGKGLTHLQRACELEPDSSSTWCNLGVGLTAALQLEKARDAFQQAVAINPGLIKARGKLAAVLLNLGQSREAVAILRGTLSLQPGCVGAWISLTNMKTERLTREDVDQLRKLLNRPGMTDDVRIPLTFALAKALEDLGDYDAAFETVHRANTLKHRHIHWSRDQEQQRIDAIGKTFHRFRPEPLDPGLGRDVIFVVSLPRSGSTLVEQILASHPQVQGLDETLVLPQLINEESQRRGVAYPAWVGDATPQDWQRMGQTYLQRIARLRDQHPRFTDKTLQNWSYVGAALAMLPGARVIESRRDPLETCFACYSQLFVAGPDFAYDLEDLVAYYAGYARLSRQWKNSYPDAFMVNHYEALQHDLEAQVRRMLAFCNLPYDPACLAFHQTQRPVFTISSAQVREPLRKDTARSARYGHKLDALRAQLHSAGLAPTGA